MVEMAVLTAVVVILQLISVFFRFGPFSITLVLVPVILGSMLFGPWAGAWLGLVFGATVLLSGDAAAFLVVNPFGTVVTVLGKGFLAGLVAGLVYRLIARKNEWAALFASSFVCPIVNTGVFLLGCLVFFMPTINEWAAEAGAPNAGYYLICGMVGINFLIELGLNLLIAPGLYRLVGLIERQKDN